MQTNADNMSVDGGFDALDYGYANTRNGSGAPAVHGERDLWCAVIAQAFLDMGAIAAPTSGRRAGLPQARGKEYDEAVRWLLRDKVDFAYICDLAGVSAPTSSLHNALLRSTQVASNDAVPIIGGTKTPAEETLEEGSEDGRDKAKLLEEEKQIAPMIGIAIGGTGNNVGAGIINSKIQNQLLSRGWNEDEVNRTINQPYVTSDAFNRATENAATTYFNKDGSYVTVDSVTKEVLQISNRNDPNWVPDNSIKNPYKP